MKTSIRHREASILSRVNSQGLQRRTAEVSGVDIAARTVELSFSSDAEVLRPFGIEILSHEAGACDLSLLNDGGPLLDGHDRSKQRGVIEHAWIDTSQRKGRAVVRFSRSAAGEELFVDVQDKIRTKVSVGYQVLEIKLTEERAHVDVYTATRWQPLEISIVPIPADTTVGVARAADISHREITPVNSGISSIHAPRTTDNMAHLQIKKLFSEARAAQSIVSHTPIGHHSPTWESRKLAAAGGHLSLSGATLSNLFDKSGNLVRTPHAAIAASSVKLSAGILKASRVASVGANILVVPDERRAIPTGRKGDVVLARVPSEFRTFQAAPFAVVPDDADVGISSYPVLSAPINFDTSIQLALRMEFSRREQKEIDQDLLSAEIEAIIALGVARAADATLLAHIAGLTPGAFTIGAAAAQGVKADELAALVGTAGNGSTFAADGTLRAAGVVAELTADATGTYIAAWDRTAVAVRDDIWVQFERLDLNGNMAVTVFVNLIALVPDVSKAWVVPA